MNDSLHTNFQDDRTRAVHAGVARDPATGASGMPIYQVSTFHQPDPEHLGEWDYSRSGNPTRAALEQAIAQLENGTRGFAFASGIAAINAALLMFKPGDHLVVGEDVYGGTYRSLTTIFARWGLEITWVDSTDSQKIEDAITPKTQAIYVETPSNPLLRITDLRAVAEIAKRHGILAITDNTFQTPLLQRPLDLGFDIVLHSATKFLGGHSDVIAGLAVTKDPALGKRLYQIQNGFGAILGPQDSWLVLRGIRSLAARMQMHQQNALAMATWLQGRSEIEQVWYPGLTTHVGHNVHVAQSCPTATLCGGAVVSFKLADDSITKNWMQSLQIPLVGVSLGGVETIVSWPRTMSHAAMPAAERARRGISDGVVRVSVGLESPNDLQTDFAQAFDTAKTNSKGETT